jgi:hypothetical protein
MLSRGFYNHMIPILFRHYRHPLGLKDIPALREDDTAAVSLANWRMAGKRRDVTAPGRQRQHGFTEVKAKENTVPTSKPKPKLAFRLLWHFRKEFLRQTVSPSPRDALKMMLIPNAPYLHFRSGPSSV